MSQKSIVVLAAGHGTRMHSETPKILHRLAGKTLLQHVIDTTTSLDCATPLVIYGFQGEKVRGDLSHLPITWVKQNEQLGTGHAVLQALPMIPSENSVLILYGDVPLISLDTLKKLITSTPKNAIGIITAHLPQPTGFGRILREKNHIIRIVEEKDATETERAITEINTGIYYLPVSYLQKWLPRLKNQNAQQEYYLTDIIAEAVKEGVPIHSISPRHPEEVMGVNDRSQLADLERFYQRQFAENLMHQGVTLHDPLRFDVRGELTIGKDVTIDINVIIEGNVTIGDHCTIGPNTVLRNVILADHVQIKANCFIEEATIAEHCVVGPFARIRAGTTLLPKAEVGNFIEIKNSRIGSFTKIHHVGYIGDCDMGKSVNIGAGTITCNYDGAEKHKTIIGDNAFIGSNSELVAPVIIGEGATIGAGSTIRLDAPPHQLTVSNTHQRTIKNWQRKTKEKV